MLYSTNIYSKRSDQDLSLEPILSSIGQLLTEIQSFEDRYQEMTENSANSNSNNSSLSNNSTNNGRGRGRFSYRGSRSGRGGRGFNRSSNNSSNGDRRATTSNGSSFSGECPELKGYIIDINTSGDKFDKTWKKIKEYVGKTYTEGGDIRCCLEQKCKVEIPKPEPLSDADKDNEVEKEIKREEIKTFT